MIVEPGHFALIVALCLTLVQAIFPLVGFVRGQTACMPRRRRWTVAAWVFAALGAAPGSCWAFYLRYRAGRHEGLGTRSLAGI
jgi:cytochrome c biogenesis factor